jgi:hypothetical protein
VFVIDLGLPLGIGHITGSRTQGTGSRPVTPAVVTVAGSAELFELGCTSFHIGCRGGLDGNGQGRNTKCFENKAHFRFLRVWIAVRLYRLVCYEAANPAPVDWTRPV